MGSTSDRLAKRGPCRLAPPVIRAVSGEERRSSNARLPVGRHAYEPGDEAYGSGRERSCQGDEAYSSGDDAYGPDLDAFGPAHEGIGSNDDAYEPYA
jgi:hypothetical protein